MPRHQRSSTPPPTEEQLLLSPGAIAKWRRLTPDARNVLARVTGREPLAANLRKARENRGLSQAAVAKRLRLSRSLVAQIELANRPVTADELAKFADLYGTPAVELTGTPVASDDLVRGALLNLAPALVKEFDIQSRIRGVLGSLMEATRLERLVGAPGAHGTADVPAAVATDVGRRDPAGRGDRCARAATARTSGCAAPGVVGSLCRPESAGLRAEVAGRVLRGCFMAIGLSGWRFSHEPHTRRRSSPARQRAWLRACRVRADGHDPRLSERERR